MTTLLIALGLLVLGIPALLRLFDVRVYKGSDLFPITDRHFLLWRVFPCSTGIFLGIRAGFPYERFIKPGRIGGTYRITTFSLALLFWECRLEYVTRYCACGSPAHES